MSKAAELANLIGNINAGGGGVNRNVIINGAMNVAQRGTSFTSVGASATQYTLDRFMWQTGNSAGRLTATQDSSAPEGFANSLKFACTTADTSIAAGEYGIIQQPIEGQNLQHFSKGTSNAKPYAVSFYVKGNASATYVCELWDNDTSGNRQISKTFNVTTDWTRVELSFPADTTGALDDDNNNSFIFNIWLHGGSTYTGGTLNSSAWASLTSANRAAGISSFFDSTDRTFFITGVQLEVGQNATEFEHEPVERTLSKCERYFLRSFHTASNSGNSQTYPGTITAEAPATNALDFQVQFITQLRTAPTFTFYRAGASGDMYNVDNAGTLSSVSLAQNWFDSNGMGGLVASGTPFTQGTRYGFDYDMDAEL